MKRLKLRKWVKVALIIILMVSSVFTYNLTGILGGLAQTSNFYLGLDILCIGLMFIQFLVAAELLGGLIWM